MNRPEEPTNEIISDGLLILSTKSQQTWLVATNLNLYYLLDDEETRAEGSVFQTKIPLEEANSFEIISRESKRGKMILIGNPQRNPWLYSEKLFSEKGGGIKSAVKDLLERASGRKEKPIDFSRIRKLIAEDEIDEAFELLDRQDKEAIVLKGRYDRLKKESRIGAVSIDDEFLKRNQIFSDLLAFLSIKERENNVDIGAYQERAFEREEKPIDISRIRKLIAEDKIHEAFRLLDGQDNVVILMQNKYAKLDRDRMLGYISPEKEELQRQQVYVSLLNYLKNMAENSDSVDSTNKKGIKENIGKKSIFISYAREDENLNKELQIAFSPLRRSQNIEIWTDANIQAGEEWDNAIQTQLRTADIILLLVSSNYLASDYIWNIELKIAMERHEKEQTTVIPIILKPCLWQEMPFSQLPVLPEGAKAITQWENRDQAYLSVVEGVVKIISN